jgi:hypothetical protein
LIAEKSPQQTLINNVPISRVDCREKPLHQQLLSTMFQLSQRLIAEEISTTKPGNKGCTETQDTQGFLREEKSRELQAFYIEIGRIAFDAKLYMLWLDCAVEQP